MTFFSEESVAKNKSHGNPDEMFDQVFQLYSLLDAIRKSYAEDTFYHSVSIEDFYGLHVLSFRDILKNPQLTIEDVKGFVRQALKDKSDECLKNNICNDRFFYNSHDVIKFAERHAYA